MAADDATRYALIAVALAVSVAGPLAAYQAYPSTPPVTPYPTSPTETAQLPAFAEALARCSSYAGPVLVKGVVAGMEWHGGALHVYVRGADGQTYVVIVPPRCSRALESLVRPGETLLIKGEAYTEHNMLLIAPRTIMVRGVQLNIAANCWHHHPSTPMHHCPMCPHP